MMTISLCTIPMLYRLRDIIGLVSSLSVPFCIEYLGKPQVDIVLQNGASSDTRFSSVNI